MLDMEGELILWQLYVSSVPSNVLQKQTVFWHSLFIRGMVLGFETFKKTLVLTQLSFVIINGNLKVRGSNGQIQNHIS